MEQIAAGFMAAWMIAGFYAYAVILNLPTKTSVSALWENSVTLFDRLEHLQDVRRADWALLNKELAKVRQDAGEAKGYLDHRITLTDEKFQKVADDFYRHLSLNAKKARGHK